MDIRSAKMVVPFIFEPGKEWKLDRDGLAAAITDKTRAILLMSPSVPSGAYLNIEDWTYLSQSYVCGMICC